MTVRPPTFARLAPLYACVFVVMTGFGMTLPALSFFTERLASKSAGPFWSVQVHIGLLTSLYALAQLGFAPIWGAASDRIGRRPIVVIGMTGFALTSVLFGMSTSLGMLYGARFLGGALSSGILPTAGAYVADTTEEEDRARGMGMLNGAVSVGGIAGPAIGGLLARRDLHLSVRFAHFHIDAFSLPFFGAAALAVVALGLALVFLREPPCDTRRPATRTEVLTPSRTRGPPMHTILLASFGAQLGIALFDSTLTLLAQHRLGYGPAQVGSLFMICGVVMASIQLGLVGRVGRGIRELAQAAAGLALMGGGLGLLAFADSWQFLVAAVAILAAGGALVAPNLAAVMSRVGGARHGKALGTQSAAQSMGQVAGPLLGTALFGGWMGGPYLLASAMMFSFALLLLLARHGSTASSAA